MGRPSVPAGFGTVAIDAPSRERVMCKCCGNPAVPSFDGIGNLSFRCPLRTVRRPESRMAPEHSFVPVRLVRESEAPPEARLRPGAPPALPAVRPGQLRCQGCAIGVEGFARFCPSCSRTRTTANMRTWRQAHRQGATAPRTCLGCGSTTPRPHGGPATQKTCPKCAPRGTASARVYKQKPCARCGRLFRPTGPAGKWHPGGCP